ncbi:MAG TPA: SsrA-binding protein SmpB [Armatimonadota bacterium]|nr:SsrA-binding protein SmpB [Armatimonadota bacterium]
MAQQGRNIVAVNRKARHDYFIEETYEAGICLAGTEVKSVRAGQVSLQDSFARVGNGEVWLVNMYVAPYEKGTRFNLEPRRPRKLLLHGSEIARLLGKTRQKGLALIPLQIYFERGYAKIELGLARGKKFYDKRQAIAERDAQREERRALVDRTTPGTR